MDSWPEGSEISVPCDVLLIHGSCIVNEAMLTGESLPQRKEGVGEAEDLDLTQPLHVADGAATGSPHRRFVVFGGTHIMQHEPEKQTALDGTKQRLQSSGAPVDGMRMERPPDRGCTAVVLRTGFETCQGKLMRTILFASERITANSAEAAAFVGILMIFAVVAAWYVLTEGLKDETRNRFKLYLHCIMIVTSVVPPELPMELSLAVTNSLSALMKVRPCLPDP